MLVLVRVASIFDSQPLMLREVTKNYRPMRYHCGDPENTVSAVRYCGCRPVFLTSSDVFVLKLGFFALTVAFILVFKTVKVNHFSLCHRFSF